jgi:hypothetical protein
LGAPLSGFARQSTFPTDYGEIIQRELTAFERLFERERMQADIEKIQRFLIGAFGLERMLRPQRPALGPTNCSDALLMSTGTIFGFAAPSRLFRPNDALSLSLPTE